MIVSKTTKQGSIAEALVCYDMAKYGIRVAPCPFQSAPYDLIAEHAGGFVKVQVKSTSRAKADRPNSYAFNMGLTDLSASDLIAYVALDKEIICYRKPENITAKAQVHVISYSNMLRMGNKDLLEVFSELEEV